MALQIRRGTSTELVNFVPAEGELIYTTDIKKLYVGDGSTAGGLDVSTAGGIGGLLSASINLNGFNIVGTGNLNTTGSLNTTGNIQSSGTITASSFQGQLVGNVIGNLAGSVFGDLQGSVFGSDSSVLVDSINSQLTGPFTGNIVSPITQIVVLDNQAATPVFYGTVAGTVIGNVIGDVVGSVFADDSSVMIDAIRNRVSNGTLELTNNTIYTESESGLELIANNTSTVKIKIPLIASPTVGGAIFTASPNILEITSVRNTLNNPQDIQSGDLIACIGFNGIQSSTSTNSTSFIGFQCDPTGTTTQNHVPSKLIIVTTSPIKGQLPGLFVFDSSGRMGVGVEQPQATADIKGTLKLEKLSSQPVFAVEGTIAIADGNSTGWDPKSTGVGQSYLCYYTGTAWIPIF